jgi:hypothetical protein
MSFANFGRLRGFGDLVSDALAYGSSLAASSSDDPRVVLDSLPRLPKPSGKVVALSPDMTLQQRLDYARAGYWAMSKYIVAGVPTSVQYTIANAMLAYARAHDLIDTQSDTTTVSDQIAVLAEADHVADSAIAQFRYYGLSLPSSAPASVKKAVAALPPVTQPPTPVTAVALHESQAGFGTLGYLAIGIGLVVFGPKLYHAVFGK